MNNIIIYESTKKIREIARTALKGRWRAMVLGVFIYYVFSTVVSSILDLFFTSVDQIELATGQVLPINIHYASSFYDFILAGPLMLGILMFMLAFFRKHTVDYAMTFEGFSMFGKGFILYLVYSIKIFLWTMLFIIPGFIAAFRYSQAFYLRVDNPDWTARQCIAESSRLMRGNKAKLFRLNLSFIGWYILAMLPVFPASFLPVTGMANIALTVILSIPVLFVDLYLMMSETVFYELLTGNLIVQERRPFTDYEV